jgi:murein DD-endopeptidase MepM/ murein hydrolase activator NlpD
MAELPRFHPVIDLPADVDVLDLSTPEGLARPRRSAFSIGRYDEARVIYTQALFDGERNIHMGIDLGGPAGTPVHAFDDGEIYCLGVNKADGDYGPTIVTQHRYDGRPLWALHGHLSAQSLHDKAPGQPIHRGAVIGWLGAESENGGWPPHVHFQLSWQRPKTHDLPGTVTRQDRDAARRRFPDPRLVLGPIY